ncbi:MAG: Glyoxalase/bleomycin resistance protein/dioxygenase [Acidimicrobiaceae bacterium]|nr:Glyoxalase/bleomycin resistance protein/dioxygenase [Acidimicrobiaceae bacterium]
MMPALRIELFSEDLDVLVDFYTRVLAFKLAVDRREAEWPYVALHRGVVRIGATRAWASVDRAVRLPPSGTELVLMVEDVGGEQERVVAEDWPLLQDLTAQPWGLTDFRLQDPDGYYWRLTD